MHVLPIYLGQVALASTLALKARLAPDSDERADGARSSSLSTKTRYRRRRFEPPKHARCVSSNCVR
jgi:hypothetical protein